MNWWDDLWLNEGFARFVQYLGAEHLYPEWKMVSRYYLWFFLIVENQTLLS